MLTKPDKNQLIIWLLIITILSAFLTGILPNDFLHISEKNYLSLGLCISFAIILTYSLFSLQQLTIKVLIWESFLLLFGIYLFLRHSDILNITLYNSDSTFFVLLILVYYFIKHALLDNPKSIGDLTTGIGVLTLFQILYGYLQLLNILPTNVGTYKLEGTLMNPGVYSNFVSLGILICIGSFWFMNNNKLKSIFLIATTILGLSILPFANSRTSWIAVITGMFYMFLIRFELRHRYLYWAKTPFRKWGIPVFILLIGILSGWFLYSYKIDSSNGRILIWKICMQMIKEKPLFGEGTDRFLREFSYAQMEYLKNPDIDFSVKLLADRAIAAFNEYLQITVELGLIGFSLFLSLILLPLKKFKIQNTTKEAHPFIAVILAVLVMALFSYPFRRVSTIIMVFVSLAAINSFKRQKIIMLAKKKYVKNVILLCLLTLTVFTGYNSVLNYMYCRKWKTTYISQKNKIDKKLTLSKYEKLYPYLAKNYDFLYNYASILKFYGEYEKSIELYTNAGSNYIDQTLLMDIAGCYHDLGDYKNAEIYCKQAIDLIPYMFVPKYRLFLLYKKNNQHEQALKMANEIYDMPIKVYSETVKNVKLNVKEYIDNN